MVHNAKMARDDPQMKLRLAPELKAAIEAAARSSGRSLNAEIVHRLENTFFEAGQTRVILGPGRGMSYVDVYPRVGSPDLTLEEQIDDAVKVLRALMDLLSAQRNRSPHISTAE